MITTPCPACGGLAELVEATLGWSWFRCRCGWDSEEESERPICEWTGLHRDSCPCSDCNPPDPGA